MLAMSSIRADPRPTGRYNSRHGEPRHPVREPARGPGRAPGRHLAARLELGPHRRQRRPDPSSSRAQEAVLAEIAGAGCVRHIWVTLGMRRARLPAQGRAARLVGRRGRSRASTCPLGDFFGVGHGLTRELRVAAAPDEPRGRRGFNCWFPMPFATARASRDAASAPSAEVLVYFYVDYEEYDALPADLAHFHAQWRRENPTDGVDDGGLHQRPAARGRARTAPAKATTSSSRPAAAATTSAATSTSTTCARPREWNWYGEGDDMIFVDGEPFPPSLHGTGTEDYFDTAWCPTQAYRRPVPRHHPARRPELVGHRSRCTASTSRTRSASASPSGSPSSTATPTAAATTSPAPPTGTRPSHTRRSTLRRSRSGCRAREPDVERGADARPSSFGARRTPLPALPPTPRAASTRPRSPGAAPPGHGNTPPPPTARTYVADRARERLHVHQQRPVRARHRAGAGRPAVRRARLARRHRHQHRRRRRPGDPRQAHARPDRAADAADGDGRPRRRAERRSARGARRRRPARDRRPATRSSLDGASSPRAQLRGRRVAADRRVRPRPQAPGRRGLLGQLRDDRRAAATWRRRSATHSLANQITAGRADVPARSLTPLQREINLVIRVVLGIVLYLELLLVLTRRRSRRSPLGEAVGEATRRSPGSCPTASSCRSPSPTRSAPCGSCASARSSSRRTRSSRSATSTCSASTRPAR